MTHEERRRVVMAALGNTLPDEYVRWERWPGTWVLAEEALRVLQSDLKAEPETPWAWTVRQLCAA